MKQTNKKKNTKTKRTQKHGICFVFGQPLLGMRSALEYGSYTQ